MRPSLLLCCLASTHALALRGAPPRPAAPRLPLPPRLCVEGSKLSPSEKAQRAAEKRREAERLALQAERASLEAERLALLAKEKMLAKRKEEAAAAPAPPPPPLVAAEAEAIAPPSLAAPAAARFNGTFDLNAALEAQANSSEAQRSAGGGLTYVLQRSGLSDAQIQLSDKQIDALKASVFSLETFYVQGVEQTALGTIFTGNLRSSAEKVSERVRARLQLSSELRGVQLLLLEDPRPLTLQELQDGAEKQPVYLALSPEAAALRQPLPEKVAAIVSLFLASISTLGYALSAFILADDGKIMKQLQEGDPAALDVALPIALGLGGIQIVHELAHLVAAGKLGLKTGIPLLLPSLQLGTFGCVTPLLSFPKSRKDLFDFALAGPAAASALSLLLYIAGLALSTGDFASSADPSTIPVLPTGLLKSSLLLGSMAQAFLPAVATQLTVQIHPLAVVGFTGVLLNALQLLPIGRLDGGRVALAAVGQSGAGLLSGIFLLGLGVSSIFVGDNPILLFFGLFIIFLQRLPEIPAEDDITEVDGSRQFTALVALAFCLLTIVPLSGGGSPTDGLF
ncbi:hypothetical protein AB1Y20_015797 [Prymnesium parvum]|uniref:Peptidase M50 domain-containing protein n=1 Tax=Prymnesium parvum TaxID=97485 RepID=A0AB34JYX0_PRYPA